ncbi:cytoplasmic protein [Serratia sp. S1B]|nr:cytoplasmic protein [Serratia sp. S1B]
MMSESIAYNIEWDDEEYDTVNTVAQALLKDQYPIWSTLLTKISNNPDSFEEEDQYDISEILADEEGDLRNGNLTNIFINFLYAEGIIELIDWKGEDDEGQLAEFATKRFQALTKNHSLAAELREQLINLTKEEEIAKACSNGESYLDEVFERIQSKLNEHDFEIAHINIGSDTYHIFIASKADYERIKDIDTPLLTMMNFIS